MTKWHQIQVFRQGVEEGGKQIIPPSFSLSFGEKHQGGVDKRRGIKYNCTPTKDNISLIKHSW